jgi:hypothetical protein
MDCDRFTYTLPAKVENKLAHIKSHSFAANNFWQSTKEIDASSVAEHCSMSRVESNSLWAKLVQLSAETIVQDASVGRSSKRGSSCGLLAACSSRPRVDGQHTLKELFDDAHLAADKHSLVASFIGASLSHLADCIGCGSYGRVFRVSSLHGKAIKITNNCVQELDILSCLKHPFIVSVSDSLWVAGLGVLIMDLAHHDLHSYAKRKRSGDVKLLLNHLVSALVHLWLKRICSASSECVSILSDCVSFKRDVDIN